MKADRFVKNLSINFHLSVISYFEGKHFKLINFQTQLVTLKFANNLEFNSPLLLHLGLIVEIHNQNADKRQV